MVTEVVVALFSSVAALIASLITAVATAWSSMRTIERTYANTIEIERFKAAEQKRKETFGFSEPLARSAYDLQSRIFSILKHDQVRAYLVHGYLVHGNERQRSYAINSTVFLVGQYLCWTEIVRREIKFIDLEESNKTRELLLLQDNIYNLWGTDQQPPLFRIFAGEQRAIGEALIQTSARGPECMGYGAFLQIYSKGANPLIDALREDVILLGSDLRQATERLTNLQHALIDLLKMLDPKYLRFPESRRYKV